MRKLVILPQLIKIGEEGDGTVSVQQGRGGAPALNFTLSPALCYNILNKVNIERGHVK